LMEPNMPNPFTNTFLSPPHFVILSDP
jgi:hypothetical protein